MALTGCVLTPSDLAVKRDYANMPEWFNFQFDRTMCHNYYYHGARILLRH